MWALLDQCLFAFSNFLLNVYLARWLDPESYGAFALAFTVFLFVGILHSSVFSEPMLVFGSGRYDKSLRPYLKLLIRLHWTRGWPIAGLLIALVAVGYRDNSAFPSILFQAFACGSVLYQWLIRRACYLRQQPSLAAIGGVLYLAMVLSGVFVLKATGTLDALHALAVMAAASLSSGALIQWRLLRSGLLTDDPGPGEKELLQAHWDYGRWSLATAFIGWLSNNIAMVSLPFWHGNQATATLRAGLNLILPVQQLLAAAGPLLLPFLVRHRTDQRYLRTTFYCGLAFLLPPLVWALVLFAAGPVASRLIYADQYTFDRSFLLLLGLSASIGSFGMVFATALRAMELPKLAFHGYAASAVVSVTVGLPLIAYKGVAGAAWALGLSVMISASVLVLILVRHAAKAKDETV